jgi:hypothetical protein
MSIKQMKIDYNVPYFNQENNEIEGWRTCGATSVAMVLAFFRINKLDCLPQYEDGVKSRFDRLGIDHGSPIGIKSLVEGLGLIDNLTLAGNLKTIEGALRTGKICIVHGYFTQSGHIIVIKGIDECGNFIVNDPTGEWTPRGYKKNSPMFEDTKGMNLTYSRKLIASACSAYSLREALNLYETWGLSEVEASGGMWIHQISK